MLVTKLEPLNKLSHLVVFNVLLRHLPNTWKSRMNNITDSYVPSTQGSHKLKTFYIRFRYF